MALRVCQLCAVDFSLNHFLCPLIDGMEDKGWDVVSVCSDGPLVHDLRKKGYQIHTTEISRNFNVFAHINAIISLSKFFRAEKFDVVHVHSPVAALVGRIAAKIANVPIVVYTAHGFYFHDEMSFIKRLIHIALERILGFFTDMLFTQSEEDAIAARKYHLAPLDHITCIGNGVNTKDFDPNSKKLSKSIREELGIPKSAFVFCMISRLVKEKGVAEFLSAAKEVALRNADAYFVLVGSRLTSDHNGDVEDAIIDAKKKLNDKLLLTGERNDIPDILDAVDVFCLPSWREGMPRSIIEAMMMGKPVVATNIRGCREEVINGVTGLLIERNNPSALKNAFFYFLGNPERAREMGRLGRERATELFDENKVIALQLRKLEDFLEKIEH